MQKMVGEMEAAPENQRRFMENLLLPNRLKDDFLRQENYMKKRLKDNVIENMIGGVGGVELSRQDTLIL